MSDDCLSTNMAAVTVIVPKQRAKMFSIREIDVITEFMKTHLSTLRASHTQGGPGAAQRQAKLWEKVTAEINACGNGPRTVKQVKEKWRNMVKMAKTDVSAERTSMRKTGGGPPRPEMSQTSQTVASLYESSASFHGVCSDADTLINVSGCTDVDIGQQVVDHLDLPQLGPAGHRDRDQRECGYNYQEYILRSCCFVQHQPANRDRSSEAGGYCARGGQYPT
ncbi:uncharacterized protein LOC128555082 [Mercenaria mercenaria]|uniref:uncharacterized protein LOC128555082 n=1 Tax=Mercenaria mercenaria TaxID=6596 RepID=UPI00234F79F4|nr:uncharacterized protein LOC128555082 [Mercenaria mercenaria]